MRVAIIGPGALGCLLATRLHLLGDCSPVLLDHDPARAALLNRQGILLEEEKHGGWGEATASPPIPVLISHPPAMVPVSTDPAVVTEAELVLLCVKAPALVPALAAITPHLSPSSLLLALQNGISHLQFFQQSRLPAPWALGVSTAGANLREAGRVRSASRGLTELGLLEQGLGEAAAATGARRLAAAAGLLARAGLPTAISPDIAGRLWRKLIINAGINALSVIHNCPNGELATNPEALRTMAAAVSEAAAVAAAEGFPLQEDPLALTLQVCRATATNISSMLQDIRRGKPTEIGAINGAVVALAARHGLPSPANQQLYHLVTALESRP